MYCINVHLFFLLNLRMGKDTARDQHLVYMLISI